VERRTLAKEYEVSEVERAHVRYTVGIAVGSGVGRGVRGAGEGCGVVQLVGVVQSTRRLPRRAEE
jgi:hypothetical protein